MPSVLRPLFSPSASSRLTALAAVLVVSAWSRAALASPSAKLVYVREAGAAACPAEPDLRKAVATRIGYDPFFPTASKTVIAQISRAKNGYRGKVQIVGDDGNVRGSRDLSTTGDDCSELLSALALAISIALDDLDDGNPVQAPAAASGSSAPPEESPPAPSAVPTGSAAPPPERPPSPPPSRAPPDDRRGVSLATSAGPAATFGIAPTAAIGGSIAATLRYRLVAARVGLRADLPASGDLTGGGTVTTSAVLGSASACLRGDRPFVCAGGGIGRFAIETSGVSSAASDRALLLTTFLTAGVDLLLTAQLYVEPFAELGLVVTRHRVEVDGADAYRLPIFTGSGGIHLGWRFF